MKNAEQQKKQESENQKGLRETREKLLQEDMKIQEFRRLQREKDQLVEEYGVRLEQIQMNMKMLDKKHFDVRQYILTMKQERDEVKNKLFRE